MILPHLLDDSFHVEDFLYLAVNDQIFALELFLLEVVRALQAFVFVEQLDLSILVVGNFFLENFLNL